MEINPKFGVRGELGREFRLCRRAGFRAATIRDVPAGSGITQGSSGTITLTRSRPIPGEGTGAIRQYVPQMALVTHFSNTRGSTQSGIDFPAGRHQAINGTHGFVEHHPFVLV